MSSSVTLVVPLSTACNCLDSFIFNYTVCCEKCYAFDLLHVEGCDLDDADCVLHRSSELLKWMIIFQRLLNAKRLPNTKPQAHTEPDSMMYTHTHTQRDTVRHRLSCNKIQKTKSNTVQPINFFSLSYRLSRSRTYAHSYTNSHTHIFCSLSVQTEAARRQNQ